MSPEGAKVLHVENTDYFAESLADFLALDGHNVALRAKTREEAEKLIQGGKLQQLGIDLVLLGDLTEGQTSSREGEEIAKLLKQEYPNLPIVGLSSKRFRKGIVDVFVEKIDCPSELVDVIKKI